MAGSPLSGATSCSTRGTVATSRVPSARAGTTEKDVNLAIALETQRQLEAEGATVVLTRTGDYRITLASRAAIAQALHPHAVHLDPPQRGPRRAPGHARRRDVLPDRLRRTPSGPAGLVYEELLRAFSAYKIDWVADRDAGAKYRLARRAAGTTTASSSGRRGSRRCCPRPRSSRTRRRRRSSSTRPSRPSRRPRSPGPWSATSPPTTPASGFVEPYPRTEPAGPGGGATGCVDPPLA